MITYWDFVKNNKKAIEQSTECACIYCFEIMKPEEIEDYCDDIVLDESEEEVTAVCPHCSIDSIIPNSLIKYTTDDLKKWHIEGWGLESMKRN